MAMSVTSWLATVSRAAKRHEGEKQSGGLYSTWTDLLVLSADGASAVPPAPTRGAGASVAASVMGYEW
eukprot:2804937-Amphidinium_carterae.2